MSDPSNETPDAAKARSRRNLAIAGALVVFVILTFIVTIVRMGGHAFDHGF
ncbi:MAG TPA: hypothetical protein VMU59_15750 [Caulobacteraceae bacterium]|nr:hypothetical protein [Caulobacteraceae bacterium]